MPRWEGPRSGPRNRPQPLLKYLGRTRGVQKSGATPHGSKLSRGALLLALQQPHDAVDVDSKARPSLALVAVEVCLALGDNALGVAVDDALERLVVGRALGPEAALVGLGYGEHLDVVDAVAAVVGRGGNAKYWSLDTLGAIVLKHELAVAIDEVEEVLGDGYDLHRLRPFIRSGARIAAGPYRWAIFYTLRHPVAHGG